jgi:hypothetical protein
VLNLGNEVGRNASLSVKRMESIMLRTFKNWPNTTVAVIGAGVLSVVFLVSIATSPGAHRTDVSIGSSQRSEPVTVGAIPQSGLREEEYIDYTVIFPQNLQ